MGINRAYVAGEIEKRPKKNKRNLMKKMKKVLEKGGKVEKLGPSPLQCRSMEKSWKTHWTDRELKDPSKEKIKQNNDLRI